MVWLCGLTFSHSRILSSVVRDVTLYVYLLCSPRLTASVDWYCYKASGDASTNNNIDNTLCERRFAWSLQRGREIGKRSGRRSVQQEKKKGSGEVSSEHANDWLESFRSPPIIPFSPAILPFQSSIPSFCLFFARYFSGGKRVCIRVCTCARFFFCVSPARSQLKRRLGHEQESRSLRECA